MSEKIKYWQTKEFVSLFDKWCEMLDNFDDCDLEMFPKNVGPVVSPVLRYPIYIDSTTFEVNDKTEYYRIARQLIHHGKFKRPPLTRTEIHFYSAQRLKSIWSLHAEGMSQKDILEHFKAKGENISIWQIKRSINHVKKTTLVEYIKENLAEAAEEEDERQEDY